MPNYNEEEMRMLANLLGKPALSNAQMVGGRGASTPNEKSAIMAAMSAPSGVASRGMDTPNEREFLANALQNPNRLPIPMNENNMPMFNTDTEYMQYLNEYDPEMFMQMQNEYYNTKGTMGEGKIEPMQYIKGLLGL
tara:strand:- start:57 stop:467 length:411 start_codon:yes stop_codon:yes gene_type:complete